MEKKNVALGIISFVFGLLSVLTICMRIEVFPALIGLIVGIVAIAKQNCQKGLAIAGVVLSCISLVAFMITILGYVISAH